MKGYSYPFHLLFFPRARHLFYDSFLVRKNVSFIIV